MFSYPKQKPGPWPALAVRWTSALALGIFTFLLGTPPAVAATAGGSGAGAGTATGTAAPAAAVRGTLTNAPCNHGHKIPGVVDCTAVVLTASDHVIRATAGGPPSTALGPADLQSAYNLPVSSGGGQTVAIVDAYGDSHAESDLAAFRSQYGLPPCTTANGCFRKIDENGGTNYPVDDSSWGVETSLDLDAVSSACPNCNILLVEGASATVDDLGTAEDTAVVQGAKYISNSYGMADLDSGSIDLYYNHPGVVVTASSGDQGNQVIYPSSDPNVVAVGGTTLTRDGSTARGWDESAWADGGSGCSLYEPKPAYQSANGLNTMCPNRATADISADADPRSGLATYDTLGYGGWLQVGGTSLASPLVAGMFALAGQPDPNTYPVTDLYDPQHETDMYDITTGSNGSCGNLLCTAEPGWDGPTGVGTPDGVAGLLAGAHGDIAGQVTDAATGTGLAGATVTASGGYQVRADSTGHYDLRVLTGTYNLTVTDFGYAQGGVTGVAVSTDQTTTENVSLQPVPSTVVSGQVTDGSGHGWPLYAELTVAGDPNGPIFTDPLTGRFSVKLPQQNTYSVQVAPTYEPGYIARTFSLATGTSATLTQNVSLSVDTAACSAPGYGWNGLSESFTGWTGATPRDGWSVTGSGHTWEFDNPGYRTAPMWPDGQFAIADSNYYGPGRMDTSLVSPVINLSGQNAPEVSFDTAYYGYPKGESANVDLSLDGGSTWSTIWAQTTADATGNVTIAIPQAAGHANARVRFHYTGNDAWWWAVDDVFVGTYTCVPVAGGLVYGVVTDSGGQPVIGAQVTSANRPLEYGITVATPDDANVPDGFYWLFSSLTGTQPFTATATGYPADTVGVNVVPNQVTSQNFTLATSG